MPLVVRSPHERVRLEDCSAQYAVFASLSPELRAALRDEPVDTLLDMLCTPTPKILHGRRCMLGDITVRTPQFTCTVARRIETIAVETPLWFAVRTLRALADRERATGLAAVHDVDSPLRHNPLAAWLGTVLGATSYAVLFPEGAGLDADIRAALHALFVQACTFGESDDCRALLALLPTFACVAENDESLLACFCAIDALENRVVTTTHLTAVRAPARMLTLATAVLAKWRTSPAPR